MKKRDYLAFVEDMIESIDKNVKYLDTVDGLTEMRDSRKSSDRG